MLRTNNKRLHSNLWTLAHFLGSAFIFLGVFFVLYSITWTAHGAYTDPTTAVSTTSPDFKYTWVQALIGSDTFTAFLPITSLVKVLVPWEVTNNSLTGMPFVLGIALDYVLWFNVFLWAVQFLVFLPDWCFHWLERKKEGD